MFKTIGMSAILAFAGASSVANAQQEASAPDEMAKGDTEEIVVTVRKTEENLQDVPLAVTALSNLTLEQATVQQLSDVANLTPGLAMQDFNVGALSTPVIRGLAQSNIQGRENNVGMFLNGIYLPSRNNMDLELLDLERVEVVKGPQSALYGRSTFAGSINYVIRQPADEFDLKVSGSAGSDEYYDGKVNLSGPITDSLSGTAAFYHREFDGTINNVASGENLGGYEGTSGLAQLAWNPSDQLSMTLTGFISSKEIESAGVFNVEPDCGNNGFGGSTYVCGTLPFMENVSEDPRASGGNADTNFAALEISYDFGNMTLTSETGYTSSDWDALTDYDATADGVPYVTVNPGGATNLNTFFFNESADDTLSQEFRLDGGGDTFQWLAGVYWTTEENSSQSSVTIESIDLLPGQSLAPVLGFFDPNPYLTPTPTQPVSIQNQATGDVDIWAVFGRGQWDFDTFGRLSVEARYSDEKRAVNGILSFTGAPSGPQSNTWEYFSPRVTYDFDLTDNTMLYGTVAGGTKSGGFNTSYSLLFPEEQFYDEETNITYELGTKGTLADDRLRYDVAVFYIDWDDMQISGASQDPVFFGSIVTNAGAATSKGIEIQLDSAVTDWLTLGGGYAYADPEFDSGVTDSSLASLCGDGTLCSTDVGGKQIGRTVKNQLNLYADLRSGLGGGGWDWYGRVDYIYRDDQPTRSANLQFIDSWNILNARLGVANEHWDIAVWGKNIFDEEIVTSQIRQPRLNDFVSPTTVIQGNLSQYALTLTYRM